MSSNFDEQKRRERVEKMKSINDILDEIIQEVNTEMEDYEPRNMFNLSEVCQENARDHLFLQLVSRELNPELPQVCACLELEDLIAVPRWSVHAGSVTGGFLVSRSIQENRLHMTDEELLNIAKENTLSQQFTVQGMSEIFREDFGAGLSEEIKDELFPKEEIETMYVMSNPDHHFGAVALLSENMLETARERIGDDYYIIPSSVHEVILMPKYICDDPTQLRNICMDVNETEVMEQDRLGDSIYLYEGDGVKLCVGKHQAMEQEKEKEKATQTRVRHRRGR